MADCPSDPEPEGCKSDRDGECNDSRCPQLRDGEPARSHRHCPLDVAYNDWCERNGYDVR